MKREDITKKLRSQLLAKLHRLTAEMLKKADEESVEKILEIKDRAEKLLRNFG